MTIKDANNLFLQGQIALAEIESNGIRIDEQKLDKYIKEIKLKISTIKERMKKDPIWDAWTQRYKKNANIGSRPQLAKVIFDDMQIPYPGTEKTKTGRYSTDETILSQIDSKFTKDFIYLERLRKLKSTYLDTLKEETVDGYYHPDHHLNTVTTYRSSADGIQTIPTRNENSRKMVRSCFIPRPGHVFIACDFSAHEFRIAASYWQDREMMKYASNPKLDIHRDVAAMLFLCPRDQITKELRYLGKNGFVFPRLYGSWYGSIAPAIWAELDDQRILDIHATSSDDFKIKGWLRNHGINELGNCDFDGIPEKGTFAYRVKKVQEWFDGKFSGFAAKSNERYQKYRERGWFKHPTGFIQSGLYDKKDLMNHPIQGCAFHCLLWTLIQLVRKEIKKRKLNAKVLAEIHDDILSDVPENEVQQYLNMVEEVVANLPKYWKWIKVPLAVEAKIGMKNWHEMRVIEKKEDGIWR